MNTLQTFSDKAAISLSFLCTLHCLATPVLLALVPSLAALGLENEAFHLWMVLIVIPTSVLALTLGCKKHKRYQVVTYGAVGIAFLVAAIALEPVVGETGEKVLTVIGAIIIAFGHFKNYRLCQNLQGEHQHSNC